MTQAPDPLAQGLALLEAGQPSAAIQLLGVALQQQPLAVEPRLGIARALLAMGDGWAAAAWLSDACRTAPQRTDLWAELARMLAHQQRWAEVEPLLATALALHPQSGVLVQLQADAFLHRRMYAQALAGLRRLLQLQPGDPGALLNCGFCLEQTLAIEEAVEMYRRALAARPGFLEAHVDLAGVLWRLEDFEGSLAHARQAVELAPEHPYALRIMGTALLNLNRLGEAEAWLRRALEAQPGLTLAEIDLAFTLLLGGRLAEGWRMYALRWRDTERMKRPGFWQAEREWQGRERQPLAGRRIAVYAEQGLGDVIQFLRYVDLLHSDGASVCAVVQPDLVPLVEHSMPEVACLAPGRTLQADFHVALLDLPMHYGTTLANIPVRVPYLRAPASAIESWRERLPPRDGRLRVGLAWTGSPEQVNNNNRAMPLSSLRPLLELPGVQWFSLQKARVPRFDDVEPAPGQLVDLTGALTDFTDSAALVEQLDLVVTVDTAIAHLAGALGRPAWVMLGPNADWRWLLDREDTPWYPSLRLFRRGPGEPRAAQVARVADALRALATRA